MTGANVIHKPTRDDFPTGRWLLPLALLIAEYVLALFFFDSERLPVTRDTKVLLQVGPCNSLTPIKT